MKKFQKSIEKRTLASDENTSSKNQLLTILLNSNQVDSSIVKTVSNVLNDKNKTQFYPINPQQVIIKSTTMIFLSCGNTGNLRDPELSFFISNTQIDEEIQNVRIIYVF